uniref:Keratin, type I cytoskeletal 17-like n=1 Tax=Podarcis muralis TaxID=64176 RepID=A0A670JN16_PODMU
MRVLTAAPSRIHAACTRVHLPASELGSKRKGPAGHAAELAQTQRGATAALSFPILLMLFAMPSGSCPGSGAKLSVIGRRKGGATRPAVYIVRSLEESNSQLENNIREIYLKRASTEAPDLSSYFNTITDLKSKIQQETLNNAGLLLQIDNAKLAADDFRVKLETEAAIRQSVEGDFGGLRKALEELNTSRATLQVQVDNLEEELAYLKRNHKEEVTSLQGRLGGTVNVEVDSMPGADLQKVLAEIRDQYEDVTEKNRREAEALHKSQMDALNQEVAVSSEALQAAMQKITELRRLAQALEIELQSLRSMKVALEGSLAETESRYGTEISRLRDLVSAREAELFQLRSDAQNQAEDYKRLMDIKNRLEQEIATYRHLLEGSEPEPPPTPVLQPSDVSEDASAGMMRGQKCTLQWK